LVTNSIDAIQTMKTEQAHISTAFN